MPNLERLLLNYNPIGNQGVAVLAAPLRKQPALKTLILMDCKIGDEAVASLVDNLGKDDFKQLRQLNLGSSEMTDKGCAMLVDAIKAGYFPSVNFVYPDGDFVSDEAEAALNAALSARKAARAG